MSGALIYSGSRPPTTTCPPRLRAAASRTPVSRRQLEALDANCAEFGVTCYPRGDADNDRPRDRARARAHPARHDDRVRRQPHIYSWRLRRSGVRHRDFGGRARPRHPDPPPTPTPNDGRHGRGRSRSRCERKGRRARNRRQARHHRRRGPRRRVPGFHDPLAVDGRPHDGLQHVHRSRCPRRDDRSRRGHLRVRPGPTPRAKKHGLGPRCRCLAWTGDRRRCPIRPRRSTSMPPQ